MPHHYLIIKEEQLYWTKKNISELSYAVLGAALDVHMHLGPGLLESVYEKCLLRELEIRKINCESQRWVQAKYKGLLIDTELRLDVLVEDILCVEIKAIYALAPVHEAILLTYMKMLQKPKGILLNFGCRHILKEGQKSLVNDFFRGLPDQ